MKRTPIYGMMAEFDSPTDLGGGGRRRPTLPATRRSTPIARFRSKNWPKPSAFTTTGVPLVVLIGGISAAWPDTLMQYWIRPSAIP